MTSARIVDLFDFLPGGLRIFLRRFFILAAIIFLMTVKAHSAWGEEKILSFHSDITVNEDASLLVKETLRVTVEGKEIKHGIYRDFPVKYQEGSGKIIKVGFTVLGAKRDGQPDGFREAEHDNGVRVYIGKPDYTVPPGEHTYELTYKTDHQLGFFKGFDELYWNVTGNGWTFYMEKVSADIHLPGDAGRHIIKTAGYTGLEGSKEQHYEASTDPSGTVSFRTTAELASFEGLTVAVAWPKGYVRPEGPPELIMPLTEWDKIKKQLLPKGTRDVEYSLIGLALLLAYYGGVWIMVGKDPEEGTIVVRYEPPSGISPAVMRFVTKMGYDDKAFTAAVINLAVKGFVTISEKSGEYTIRKIDKSDESLSFEEMKAYQELFSLGGRELTLEQRNHTSIAAAIKSVKEYLRKKFEKLYFVTNRRYFISGLVITCLLLFFVGFGTALSRGTAPLFLFMSIWLTGWSAGVIMLLKQAFFAWRQAIFTHGLSRLGSLIGALFSTMFALPFLGGEGFGLYLMATSTSLFVSLFLVAAMTVNYLFFHLLKAPTGAGRKLMDEIEGFRRYLGATERDRMNMMHPAGRTPQLFERYLPYALALDVEQQWSEQFADVLSSASERPREGGSGPVWYSGSSWDSFSKAGFASAFAGAISASSTAPGSRSGSGGGGSSGGGGGGGGGGGW
jgi:hypothetical protein